MREHLCLPRAEPARGKRLPFRLAIHLPASVLSAAFCLPHFRLLCAAVFCLALGSGLFGGEVPGTAPELAQRFDEIRQQLGTPVRHFQDGDEADWTDRLDLAGHHRNLLREKLAGEWFAALVSTRRGERSAIAGRFRTYEGFARFLQEQQPLVEVWVRTADEEGVARERRLTAMEVASIRAADREVPTTLELTLPDARTGRVETYRVEFSFDAAASARETLLAYERHRATLLRLQEILGERNEAGRFSAVAQWTALHQAVREGHLTIQHPPVPPTTETDLYVAYEYAVDEQGLFRELVRVYRESEIERTVRNGQQLLRLKPSWEQVEFQARAFRERPFSDELEPALNPLMGQDVVELRVVGWEELEPRRWNMLEFGEPDLLRESALARLGLINAHLDRQRKQIAWRKGRYDIYAEFLFAGLNIGGGFAGFGFPLGDAARLAYNLAITPQFLPDLPNAKQMRELFAWLTAYQGHPKLGRKPAASLDQQDIEELRVVLGQLTEAQVQATLERLTEEDLKAMLSLARFQGWDARYRLFVDLLSTAARVSGESGSGLLRDLFNNPYFALNGDLSIKNILLAAFGYKEATPFSGATLEQMADGQRDAISWLAFFDVTVDIRSLINTIHRLRAKDLAEKELRTPFPHAPRASDLAAYEIRAFGFPLLIFHKRGLLKADIAAYEQDYAYSLIGTRIVQHFPTREDFERAIAARHVIPLGYVKVRDASGRLRESRLAVFAHNLVEGKQRGKTALVLYGLKAYAEYSQYMDRELERFAQYEQLLREGGVIERVVDAENKEELPRVEFEPRLHRGPEARQERFANRLGPMLELQRLARRRQWGIPDPNDPVLADALRGGLAKAGIRVVEDAAGPVLRVDRYQAACRYREWVDGRWREVQLVAVSGPAEIRNELAKAEAAIAIEATRKSCLGGGLPTLVLLNEAIPEGNRYRMGPLRRGASGSVWGSGVVTNTAAIDRLWARLAELPGSLWTTLHAQRFAGTLVEVDVDQDGQREKVFLTFEYPAAANVRSRRINPANGQPEIIVLEDGLCRSSIDPFRVVDFDYDKTTRKELRTRVYQNVGTLDDPRRGRLVEETTTLEEWFRQPEQPDPHLPVMAKLRFNHVTGEASYELYGGYPLPIEVRNAQWVTESRYRGSGQLEFTRMFHNGERVEDAGRPLLDQLLRPVRGRERFRIRPLAVERPPEANGVRPVLPALVERIDLVKGVTNRIAYDTARHGRKVAEWLEDPFDGTRTFLSLTTNVYREDFYCGLVPFSSERRDAVTGVVLAEIQVSSYDPVRRELTGTETDETGKRTTVVWASRWENPIRINSDLRRTEYEYDPWESNFTGRTLTRDTGEVLSSYTGAYDPVERVWKVRRVLWYRPGITNWTEEALFSLGGKRIRTRSGEGPEMRETRVFYDAGGRVTATELAYRGANSHRFEHLVRKESGFEWRLGACTATVETFVEGNPHDQFRSSTDAEGRVVRDGERVFSRSSSPATRLAFWTEVDYEGATDRVRESREYLDGTVRLTRRVLPEIMEADGAVAIPVVTIPGWGLVSTQRFVLGYPWGRPSSTTLENGEQVEVREWYPGTRIPKVSEIVDRGNRVRERFVARLNAGEEDGIPWDRVSRYRMAPWAADGGGREEGSGLAAEEAQVRGTDVKLFQVSADRKVVYDPSRLHPAPLYAVDVSGRAGVLVEVAGQRVPRVLAFYSTETNGVFLELRGANQPGIRELEVDLQSLFYHRVARRLVDQRGSLLEEHTGRILNQGPALYTRERLLAAAGSMTPEKSFLYAYEPGWLVEQNAASGAPRSLFFTSGAPAEGRSFAVNADGRHEFATRVQGSRLADAGRRGVRSQWVFRQLRSPVLLASNPLLPGSADYWTRWAVEEMDREGRFLHRAEHTFDAQGRLRTARTLKWTESGREGRRPAVRTVYHLVPTAGELRLALSPGEDRVELPLGSDGDLRTVDFVCWQVERDPEAVLGLTFVDASGQKVEAQAGRPDYQNQRVGFWYPDAENAGWFPDVAVPEQMTAVTASPALREEDRLLLVAVADLAAAGLDVGRVRSVFLTYPGGAPEAVRVSALQRLDRGRPAVGWRSPTEVTVTERSGFEGLGQLERVYRGTSAQEDLTGRFSSAVVRWNQLPIALTRPSPRPSPYPTLVFIDQSEIESPKPLYAVSSRDGQLIEHYRKVELGNATHVYSIVHGFEIPRYEVFRGEVLGDEMAPGFMAYGYDYHARVEYQRAAGWAGRTLARVRNRIAANSFNYYGDKLIRQLGGEIVDPSYASQFDYGELHGAQAQADAVARQPVLAQVLLPFREPPWQRARPAPASGALAADAQLWRRLLELHTTSYSTNLTPFYDATYLIPTPPGTDPEIERYVDTVAEADVIRLAIHLGEYGLAADLLDFYRRKFRERAEPLHASYDAKTGTAMVKEYGLPRAMQARATSEAQVAVAEAAFDLGWHTGDRAWLEFGRSLLTNSLAAFRSDSLQDYPRGLTHYRARPDLNALGFFLWPNERRHPLRANARAYLLLRTIVERSTLFAEDPPWEPQCRDAVAEFEAWFRKWILPAVESSGVVPTTVSELQDVQGKTRALGVDRWTGTAAWLAFLEVAQAMGVPTNQTHLWLENLVRAHGVRSGSAEGLDFGVPLLRAEAISSELTARLWRVARRLGHEPIARYAEAALASLRQPDGFPVVVTSASAERPIKTGQDTTVFPDARRSGWPRSVAIYHDLLDRPAAVPSAPLRSSGAAAEFQPEPSLLTDQMVFNLITGTFYFLLFLTAVFWWRYRILRLRERERAREEKRKKLVDVRLVPEAVMQQAEERWAKRVLGAQTPANAEHTRLSNATVEQNFLMQLRAFYKMVIEWRRQENEWAEHDPRLVEGEEDDWLNGLDEFASVMGIYMRFVIKAGAKDGRHRQDAVAEHEDSNHIWSRLLMYFSEYHWAMTTSLEKYNNAAVVSLKEECCREILELLKMLGVRQRTSGFDARRLFNYPTNPGAFDLLVVQKPGATLAKVLLEASLKLRIPYSHLVGMIERYKAFKRREALDPVHPYVIEFAKILPHFLLMGLGALVWYNQETLADSPVVPWLWSQAAGFTQNTAALVWALPLFAGMLLSVLGRFVRTYRFEGSMLPRTDLPFIFDATVTRLLGKKHMAMPAVRPGWGWDPRLYEWSGWTLRAFGCLALGLVLLELDTPSFATFLVVKGILAMLALVEVAAILLPLATTGLSRWLQDYVARHPACPSALRFLHRLNFSGTRPASPLWLSIQYVTQPTVPSGNGLSLVQAMAFYFGLAAAFFFVGGFLCQQILSLWFTETYLNNANWKLVLGGLLFWNTMYLLRYGLFLLCTAVASLLAAFPLRTLALGIGLLQLAWTGLAGLAPVLPRGWPPPPSSGIACTMAVALCLLAIFEEPIRRTWRRLTGADRLEERRRTTVRAELERIRQNPEHKVGIVYMSGDDLGHAKLTPDLLMSRWELLREKYGSRGLRLLAGLTGEPDTAALRQAFAELYELEQRCQVTLWHPAQLAVAGENPSLPPEAGLLLGIDNEAARRRLLTAWHARRWLVTMMSTAGHSQDTAITLVDIAARLGREGLAANTVFYLIQNKYDDRDNNRPVQLSYTEGELADRNKLCRLLEAMAPGLRAYSVQNWTPFGFKAGGMTGMDLVHEESLRLGTMVVLDRNATVHDLDGFMEDLAEAMTDPNLVIVIPGRGTTNTLTEIGQGSQMIEEGHRSFLRGLMSWLGGAASECLGTGWGNIVAYSYGRVQRAMLHPDTPRMPLTSRQYRGSNFGNRTEGLIGFTPHAVGISEDTWAVSQAAHNLLALGGRVRFRLSRAMWHKIRETWSHAEWLASFPRWSGGYLQMMQDAVMQRINDFGMFSVFSKEIRSNSGRCYLSAPFALVNILLLPLAILADVTPFVQILIVLWNFGFVMNQVLTLHGLNAYLESTGYSRRMSLAGMLAGGTLGWLMPSLLAPYTPGLVLVGGFAGGFWLGLSRWVYTRLRDVILFGPQLILHTLGQVMRQTIEFVTSGAGTADAQGVNLAFRAWAGPREDQPLAAYPHFINLRTVVWVVGLPSVALNLIALSNLDMFNVILLLPSLLFSASVLAGPFLMTPKPGVPAGWRTQLFKWLAWPTAFGFYAAVSMLVARGDAWQLWGALALVTVLGLSLQPAIRHLGFRTRLGWLQQRLRSQLEAAGLAAAEARKALPQILQQASDTAKLQAHLESQQLPPETVGPIVKLVQQRLAPLLKDPVRPLRARSPLWERVAVEYGRSFVLALVTFLWFLVVPVPGLFVFAAGDYRTSMTLGTIMVGVLAIVAVAIGGYWLGVAIQAAQRRLARGSGLEDRARLAFRTLQSSTATTGHLAADEVSRLYALFVDLKTYVDQRADAYAWRCLRQIEEGVRPLDPGVAQANPQSL